jgi:hypothetical protein
MVAGHVPQQLSRRGRVSGRSAGAHQKIVVEKNFSLK